jgi:hypothetical protein
MKNNLLHPLIEKLKNFEVKHPVIVMPDFIIDHILKLKSRQELLDLINKKTEFGAGAVFLITNTEVYYSQ